MNIHEKYTAVIFGKRVRCTNPLLESCGGCPLAPSWGGPSEYALFPSCCIGEENNWEDTCDNLVEVED